MLSHTSMRRHAPEYFSMVRRSACCASRDSLSTSFSTSTREDGGVSETSCIAMHRLLRTFVALATLHADEAPPRHVLDDLLHDVAVLGAARVGGVHLDMVVATHQRQVHLHLALPHLNLPLLLLHLDALHAGAKQLLQQSKHQSLLASARRAVEQHVGAVAVRHLGGTGGGAGVRQKAQRQGGGARVSTSGHSLSLGLLPPRPVTCATDACRDAHAHREATDKHTRAAAHTPLPRSQPARPRLPSSCGQGGTCQVPQVGANILVHYQLVQRVWPVLVHLRERTRQAVARQGHSEPEVAEGGAHPERHGGRAGTRAARARVNVRSQRTAWRRT